MSPLRIGTNLSFRTLLLYTLVLFGVTAFIVYVLFQARFILEGPQILLTSETSTAQTERIVTLEGQVRNIVRMSLNGRQIYTDKYGNFKEALVLENGYTIATLQAVDRYGRTRSLTQQFVHINDEEATEEVIN